jgi:membrane associated rhomboid family serine protease
VDLYLGISGQSIFGGGGIAHFAHVGGALFGFNHVVLEKKSVQR